ncbi:hypothetical protein H4R27_004777 [Coemansia aciculifera]|nr:hypothetical protein H4R27_004777 [Coemansia aciculifera]
MHPVSPLQTLPLRVVQLIVNHVVGCSRLVFAEVINQPKEYTMLLRPLLWVCRNFRNVARSLYCSSFDLSLHSARFNEPNNQDTRPRLFDLGYPTHHLAKALTISLTEASIYSGQVLEGLSQSPYCGQAFPLVHKITLFIAMDDPGEIGKEIEPNPLVVEANIDAFALRVKEMAPLLNEIRIELDHEYLLPEITSRHFDSLVPRLTQLVDSIGYFDYGNTRVVAEFQLDGIRDLVQIKCHLEGDNNQFTLLARRNAQSLEYLSLGSDEGINIPSLIQNSDGSCVVYSHLHTLDICDYPRVPALVLPIFPSAVPFPRLVRLSLPAFYPLGDDTLFRGNAAILEHLVLKLDPAVVTMLRKHTVFTQTSHPMLQSVIILCNDTHKNGLVPGTFATADETMIFCLSIGPGAPVYEIYGAAYMGKLTIAPTMFGSHTNIQVLNLVWGCIELWEVITLIQSLPLLSDLHTPQPKPVPVPDDIFHDDLPDYVQRTYAPASKRFRCWHLSYYCFGDHRDVVMCVLLLALVCPNFNYAATTSDMRQGFMRQMEESIASEAFKKYAPRLQRLLL